MKTISSRQLTHSQQLNSLSGLTTGSATDPDGSELMAERNVLVHGRLCLEVSTMASQWYCEKKTDLSIRHPEIEVQSLALESGTGGHEELSRGAVTITENEFERALKQKKKVLLQESRFEATFDSVRIVGVPDLIEFHGQRGLLVLEFKFSGRSRPFIDRYVQAQLYGWLLQRNGFDVTRLVCAVCVIPHVYGVISRSSKLEMLTERGFLEDITAACTTARKKMSQHPMTNGKPLTMAEGGWTLHLYRYEESAAEILLRWSFEYWFGNREPMPTKNPAKCRSCPFNAAGACNSTLHSPDAGFKIRRRKGLIIVQAPWC